MNRLRMKCVSFVGMAALVGSGLIGLPAQASQTSAGGSDIQAVVEGQELCPIQGGAEVVFDDESTVYYVEGDGELVTEDPGYVCMQTADVVIPDPTFAGEDSTFAGEESPIA